MEDIIKLEVDIPMSSDVDLGMTPKKEKKNKGGHEDCKMRDKGDPNLNESSVTGRWNKEEHDKFIDAIKKFGKDWKQVEQYIESRTGAQIRSHAQKFFNRIIKKYNIEKNEVIDFVHNAYNSNLDSSIQSPKRKKKSEGPTTAVTVNPQVQKGLYVFNDISMKEEKPKLKNSKNSSRDSSLRWQQK